MEEVGIGQIKVFSSLIETSYFNFNTKFTLLINFSKSTVKASLVLKENRAKSLYFKQHYLFS